MIPHAAANDDTVLIERQDDVALLRLNRPAALNAVDHAMRAALTGSLRALDADPAVRAIVMTGQGDRAFCGRQDL